MKICQGAEYDLSATVTVGGSYTGPLSYHWSSNHAALPESPDELPLLFTEDITSKDPGIYEFILQIEDEHNGCYDEAVVDVEILPRWRYKGFESNVVFAAGYGLSGSFWEGEIDDNVIYTSDHPIIVSGAKLPITHEWLEDLLPNLVDVDVNADGVPFGGSFFTSKDYPFLTIRMTDANGCYKDFKTNRHLVLDYPDNPPELTINLLNLSNPVVCKGGDICFMIKLETNYKGGNEWLLPYTIELDYSIDHHTSGGIVNAQAGILVLTLANANDGVYIAQFCYNNAIPPGGPALFHTTLTISGLLGDSPFLDIMGSYQFYVSDNSSYGPHQEICIDKNFEVAVELSINPENCTSGGLILNPGSPPNYDDSKYTWRGGINGYVDIDGLTTNEGGFVQYLHAFIDQCIEEDLLPPDDEVEERAANEITENMADTILVNAGLKVQPNPFSGGVLISYSILSENGPVPVTIKIMDATGKTVHIAKSDEMHKDGNYTLEYDGRELAPGVYFVQMITENKKVSEKMVKISDR